MYCLRSLILLTLYVFLAASVFAQEPSGPVSDSGFSRVGAVSLESEADDPLKIIYFLPRSGEDPETFVEQTFQQNRLTKMDKVRAANVMNNWGVLLAKGGYYPHAAAALRRALDLDKKAVIYSNLSTVYDKLSKPEDSAAAAELGVKLAPDDVRLQSQLCTARLFTNQFKAAVTCYEELQKLTEINDYYMSGYGIALERAGFPVKAIKVLESLGATASRDYTVLNALGMAYCLQKNYLKAVEKFKTAVEAAPERGLARYNLAIVELRQRNRLGALSQYKLLEESSSPFAEKLGKVLFKDKVLDAGIK